MDGLINILGQAIQFLINGIIGIINGISRLIETLLPASPFSIIEQYINDIPWLGVLNYFIPLSGILDILVGWAGAMVLYFVIAILLRWVKVVK